MDLTDDELWRAIATNTDGWATLVHQRATMDAEIESATDPTERSAMLQSYVAMVNRFEGEYRAYAAELRRRYPA